MKGAHELLPDLRRRIAELECDLAQQRGELAGTTKRLEGLVSELRDDLKKVRQRAEQAEADLMLDETQDFRRYAHLRRHFLRIVEELHDPEIAVRDINALLDQTDPDDVIGSYVNTLLDAWRESKK